MILYDKNMYNRLSARLTEYKNQQITQQQPQIYTQSVRL